MPDDCCSTVKTAGMTTDAIGTHGTALSTGATVAATGTVIADIGSTARAIVVTATATITRALCSSSTFARLFWAHSTAPPETAGFFIGHRQPEGAAKNSRASGT